MYQKRLMALSLTFTSLFGQSYFKLLGRTHLDACKDCPSQTYFLSNFYILPLPSLKIQHMLGEQRGITQSRHKQPHIRASMLYLFALALSRRHSTFLIDTFKAQEKTTTLAVQLAGVIPTTVNLSLIDILVCTIIQAGPPLLIRTWDSRIAIHRLLSDVFRLFESPTLNQTTCAPRRSACLNGNNLINAFQVAVSRVPQGVILGASIGSISSRLHGSRCSALNWAGSSTASSWLR